MNEVGERSVRRWKASFVVAVALVGTLAISSLWLFMRTDSLQLQVGNLQTENDSFQSSVVNLQTKVSNLESAKIGLQSEVGDLNDEITDLELEISDLYWEIYLLEEPQLHKVDTSWYWYSTTNDVVYSGIIFNSGLYTALNVVITVRMYDAYDILLGTEEIHLGSISGKDYQIFDVDIYCYTKPDHITATLDWD